MSESNETVTALDRIRGWREKYRLGLSPSPLEDVTQLSAQLDMTHAHPSGIAQLFASGHVQLDSLFRDNGMLRAAGRRVERVLDDREAKSRVSGVGELSLVVGVAIWKGNQMTVLMYPVEGRKEGRNIENGTVIAFTGRVRLNAAFAAVLRENNVVLDESKLFDGSNYESGTPETSAVFAAITRLAANAFPDFEIERRSSTSWRKVRPAIPPWTLWRETSPPPKRWKVPKFRSTVRLMPILMASMRSAMRTIPSDTPRSLLPRAIRCLWIVRSPTIPPSRPRRLRRVA